MGEEYDSDGWRVDRDVRRAAIDEINGSIECPDELRRLLLMWADGEMTIEHIVNVTKERYKIYELPVLPPE